MSQFLPLLPWSSRRAGGPEKEPGTTGEVVGLYVQEFRPGIGLSRVSGKRDVCCCPWSREHCRALLFHFLIPAVLPSLSFAPLTQDPALPLPPPQECQREALGGQWDSLSAESFSLFAGAASATYRWIDAAGSPAAQQALAEQSRLCRWQSIAHPGWRLSHKLAVLSRGLLMGCLGTGQGHPGWLAILPWTQEL
ncbi:hypothetical protein HPG69_006063 [Diceros bicornis minor]|uniref:Uncharacterized protein n=1 Tax=Diceros bicornis minor TaxID=77932 RepID=A0A7J7EUU0_DICBM|nr:hypothetical protein HPG69_006063 [Diceros bicornis minor]